MKLRADTFLKNYKLPMGFFRSHRLRMNIFISGGRVCLFEDKNNNHNSDYRLVLPVLLKYETGFSRYSLVYSIILLKCKQNIPVKNLIRNLSIQRTQFFPIFFF